MPTLDPSEYRIAAPLFERLGQFHLCVQTVLEGAAPGWVWVDNAQQPRVGFVKGQEGNYLAGDPGCQNAFAELREVIPYYAYLIADPIDWQNVFSQVWKNPAWRPHPREHYVYRKSTAPAWREHVPEGMRVQAVDEAFFQMSHLENFDMVEDWVDTWSSREAFFKHGCGTCIVHGDTIASWSVMDCYLRERCEIGIITDKKYRRQGLAKLAASATVEACLAKGYREIGWQCLRSNAGSKAVALRVGFEKERNYLAFSNWLPANTPGDLSQAEYEDWAHHYEQVAQNEIGWAILAAQAWALAGSSQKALENLRVLCQAEWKLPDDDIVNHWPFDSLRDLPEFQSLAAKLIKGETPEA